jgi:hypothetical protein
MAVKRSKRLDRFTNNHDNSDGLKINRICSEFRVSGYRMHFSTWEEDNYVMRNPGGGGYFHVGIIKKMKVVNRGRCQKINRYKGKTNGRF